MVFHLGKPVLLPLCVALRVLRQQRLADKELTVFHL
jgi:hypothetical protein